MHRLFLVTLIGSLIAQVLASPMQFSSAHVMKGWLSEFLLDHQDSSEAMLSSISNLSDRESFFERAALLIIEHPERFDLPFRASNMDVDQIRAELKQAWDTQSVPGSLAGRAVLVEAHKWMAVEKIYSLTGLFVRFISENKDALPRFDKVVASISLAHILLPMIRGMAINAP